MIKESSTKFIMVDPQIIWDNLFKSLREYLKNKPLSKDFTKLFSFTNLASFVSDCGPVLMEAKSDLAIFETLCKLENEVKDIRNIDDAINHIKDYCSKAKKFEEIWEQCKGLSDKDEVLGVMHRFKVEQSNNMIKEMFKTSMLVSIFQFFKIYTAWKTISEASNIINDERKFELIKREIQMLSEMLNEIFAKYEEDPRDQSINLSITIFNTKYTSTVELIRDLKVKIDGHIKEVGHIIETSLVGGAAGVANASIQGYQLYKGWQLLTNPSKALGMASLMTSLLSGFASFQVYGVSRETMQSLQRELGEVNRLKSEVDLLHGQVLQLLKKNNN